MRVNSVYGSVLSEHENNQVDCELFVGPVKVIVQLPKNKFPDPPYCGMPILLTVGHGHYANHITIQVRQADAKLFEIMTAEIESALQIIGA